MTAAELLKSQIDESEFQLRKIFEGMTDEQLDAKPIPTMGSAREQAAHLVEVYVATVKMVNGQEHEWGSVVPDDMSWPALMDDMFAKRAEATVAVLASEDPKALGTGAAFLGTHDSYHVGQIAAIRISTDPEWNPYSIYRFE